MTGAERTVEQAPRAFLSHASEDKPFVEALARRLRADGVDAWFDGWEILAGDKLVPRIFDEGIGKCEVFVIALSSSSIGKPWVQEELEAGVVQRIAGKLKLIPIRLDSVPVPVALQATRYVSIADRDRYEAEYQELLSAIFNATHRPPLGSRPEGLNPLPLAPSGYSIEEARLLEFIARTERAEAEGASLDDEEIASAFPHLSQDLIVDAVEALCDVGAISAGRGFNGVFGVRMRAAGWRDIAGAFGLDADIDARTVLAHLVAAGRGQLVPGTELITLLDEDEYRARMAVDLLDDQGLVIASRVAGGFRNHHVGANAAGRRRARELT